ncbi:hypothetical protein [Flagellimonas baculiformis]|uniref:hypothetical protein n=1 Tax=Flagellimonas baculiformis TaxID=3067310 RepID=UPI00296E8CE0|nr:hypothetical protein [Muricauda sp. D6]
MGTRCKKILWMALVLFAVHGAKAQERVQKTIEKSFPLLGTGELQLENKYGNVTLKGWDQNKVSITISIKVNHRRKENAEDLLQRINPEIKTSNSYVSIVSEISNKNTGWFADFFNRNNPIDFDRSHVQIDYEIHLPVKAGIKVTNRFGDVVLENCDGPLTALIEHGNLWIGENLNKADIILKYGKVRAKNLNYADLELKNGELDMEDSKSLRLRSDGTEINIHSVSSLEIYSNKDNILVSEAGTLYGSMEFTTFKLDRLAQEVDLKLKIVDFRVYEITNPSAEISIEQESADISLSVTNFSHRFTATLEEGVVRLPKSFENVNSEMLDKGRRLRKIEATYGQEKKGSISINGEKGIVTLND